MSGVLNWLLQGCLEWQRNGLQESAEITAATRDYRNEYDVIQQFFDEKCVINSEIIVTTSCLYNCYVDFARENNLRNIMTKIMFTKKIRDKNCEVFRGSGNIQKIKGIGILADLDDKERPY
jgi:putative DNA primase/helicase